MFRMFRWKKKVPPVNVNPELDDVRMKDTTGTDDDVKSSNLRKRVFRITGIPAKSTSDDVNQRLRNDDDFKKITDAVDPKTPYTLVLYPSLNGNFQTGILSVVAPEDLLNKFVLENKDRYIPWIDDDEDVDIAIDCHFRGLTPLNRCEEPEVE